MKKIFLVLSTLIVVCVIAIILAFFVSKNYSDTLRNLFQNQDTTEEQTESAALPDIQPTKNPGESIPELNPVQKTNVFSGAYKNPFE